MPRPSAAPSPAAPLLTGAAVLGAASLGATALPPLVVALALVLAGMRAMWLEQNIYEDLSAARDLPPGYEGVAKRAEAAQPLALATAMRAEAQAWSAALCGAAASLAWAGAPDGLGLVGWAALFGLGLLRADRMAATLRLMDEGRTLDAARLRRPVGVVLPLERPPRD